MESVGEVAAKPFQKWARAISQLKSGTGKSGTGALRVCDCF